VDRADAASGAVLMERFAGPSLLRLPVLEACSELGWLVSALAVPVEDARGLPGTDDAARELAAAIEARRGDLLGAFGEVLVAAAATAADRLHSPAELVAVDGDLHSEQVLRRPSDGVWTVIDPSVLVGDREYAAAPALWTRLDEFADDDAVRAGLAALARAGRLDAARAADWVLARCLQYWLWGSERGLTEDPERCVRLASAIAPGVRRRSGTRG
jgi:streptomycin 6-kinase